jgi:hypothetical protein
LRKQEEEEDETNLLALAKNGLEWRGSAVSFHDLGNHLLNA